MSRIINSDLNALDYQLCAGFQFFDLIGIVALGRRGLVQLSLLESRMRHHLSAVFLFVCGVTFASAAASASTIRATVDLSQQRMTVYVAGRKKYTWPVSTGKKGWRTKTGVYTPYAQRENFYSTKWNMSLPYLTMIGYDGTAVHGTYQTSRLGRPASHGCIRLSVSNARRFYQLVQRFGFSETQVIVTP